MTFPGFTPQRFQYRVIQLNHLIWRRLVDQPNPVASASMAKMKLDPARMQFLSGFIDT